MNQSDKFLQFLFKSLRENQHHLGDRSTYVGASDVGQCLKRAYLGKVQGEEHDDKQLLIFKRGHVSEGIIKEVLENGNISYEEQKRLRGRGDLSFLEVGPDFLVHFPKECVVIECKTISSPLPNNAPRESWILQVQLQMHLAFLEYQRPIRGIIIALNINTGIAQEFHIQPNATLLDVALTRAKRLWKAMQEREEPQGEISDLCAYCPFKGSCETLREGAEALPSEIIQMALRLKELSATEKEVKEIKENLKAYMEAAKIKKALAGELTLSLVSYKGRESVDTKKLKESFPDIAMQVTKVGEGYSTLKVS